MTGGEAPARGVGTPASGRVRIGADVGIDGAATGAATGAAMVGMDAEGAGNDWLAAGVEGRVNETLESATVVTPKPVP